MQKLDVNYPYKLHYADNKMYIKFTDIDLELCLTSKDLCLTVNSCSEDISEIDLYKHLYFAEKNKMLFTVENTNANDVSCINIVKRAYVETLLQYIQSSKYAFITGVIVFGSCITYSCTEKSDIDLIFIMRAEDIVEKGDLLMELYRACQATVVTEVDTLYVNSLSDFYEGKSSLYECLLQDDAYKVLYTRG